MNEVIVTDIELNLRIILVCDSNNFYGMHRAILSFEV